MLSLSQLSAIFIIRTMLSPGELHIVANFKKELLAVRKKELQVRFIESCVREKVVPKFVELRIPSHLAQYKHLFRKGQLQSLTKMGKRERVSLQRLMSAKTSRDMELQKHLGEKKMSALVIYGEFWVKGKIQKIEAIHAKKLANLISAKPLVNTFTVENTVLNISDRQLTNIEHEALSYGMNMAWPTIKPSILRQKIETESFYERFCERNKLNPSDQELLSTVRRIFNQCNKKYRIPADVSLKN